MFNIVSDEFNSFQDEIQQKYEIIRPVLLKQVTARERAKQLSLHENTLSKYIRRFKEEGILGLADQRHGPKDSNQWLTVEIKAEVFSLYNANPSFSYREIARIVSEKYNRSVDHKSIKKIIEEGEAYFQYQKKKMEEEAEHYFCRFRYYHEYLPIVAGRARIIELLEAGWTVSAISTTLKVSRPTIYYWQRRFSEQGIAGLSDKERARTHFEQLVTVEDISLIFEFIENNPKIGHYRVKMFLNGKGQILGHTKIWEIVSLYREATEKEKQIEEYEKDVGFPFKSNRPHHHWFYDVRYLVKYNGEWVYSILILDGYSRKILSGGAFLQQDFPHLLIVIKDALMHNGRPENIVSDNGGIFKTNVLLEAYEELDIDPIYIEKGKPWQNLMEATFSIERRMLDSYVSDCDDLKQIYARHQRFIEEYNDCGHWHHKRKTVDGRIYYQTPNAVMGDAYGQTITEKQVESLFALKHCVRTVDKHGQVKLDNHIFYVDEGLRKEKVKISIYSDFLRVEFNVRVIVEYPCCYDIKKKKITRIDPTAIWWTAQKSKQIAFFSYELYRIVFVVTTTRRRRLKIDATQMSLNFL